MRQGYKDLFSISLKLDSPKISSSLVRTDLKKVKELYFKAKEIFLSISQPDEFEIEEMIEIFGKGIRITEEFVSRWVEGKVYPTDEELGLLMEAADEASNNFNTLSERFPSDFSAESNKENQEKITKGKEFVLEEKRNRANNEQQEDKTNEMNNLQSQLNSLQNQRLSNNNDNEAKIKDLQRQIEELKKKKPTSPPNPEVPQQSTSLSSKGNNDSFLVGGFCLIFGVCLVLVIGFLVLKKKKKIRGTDSPPNNWN